MKIDHISASQIKTYIRCPAAYRFSYGMGLRADTINKNMAIGIGVGKALAEDWQGKPMAQALDLWSDTWRDYMGQAWDLIDPDEDRAAIVDKGVDMLTALAASDLPAHLGMPEYFVKTTLADPDTGEALPELYAYFDFYDPLANSIYELKTSRGIGKWDAHLVQLALYEAAATQSTEDGPAEPPSVSLIQVSRAKKPRVQVDPCEITHQQSQWVLRSTAQIVRAIEADQTPALPSFMCAGCEFKRACQSRDFTGLVEKKHSRS